MRLHGLVLVLTLSALGWASAGCSSDAASDPSLAKGTISGKGDTAQTLADAAAADAASADDVAAGAEDTAAGPADLVADVPAGPVCGDGKCEADEATQCPKDCPVCGDGKCAPDELAAGSCPKDCAVCGDAKCEGDEKTSCPKDCTNVTPPAPVCGDAKCDKGEDNANCPKDCLAPPAAVCGDGKCDKGEDTASCAKDCPASSGGGTADIMKCITGKCSSELTDCFGDDDCLTAVGCITGCGKDYGCYLKCYFGAPGASQKLLYKVLECGGTQGCVSIPGLTPPGGGGAGKCGDGKCDPLEQYTCKKDCP